MYLSCSGLILSGGVLFPLVPRHRSQEPTSAVAYDWKRSAFLKSRLFLSSTVTVFWLTFVSASLNKDQDATKGTLKQFSLLYNIVSWFDLSHWHRTVHSAVVKGQWFEVLLRRYKLQYRFSGTTELLQSGAITRKPKGCYVGFT